MSDYRLKTTQNILTEFSNDITPELNVPGTHNSVQQQNSSNIDMYINKNNSTTNNNNDSNVRQMIIAVNR